MFRYRRHHYAYDTRNEIESFENENYHDCDDDYYDDTYESVREWIESGAKYSFATIIYDGNLHAIANQLRGLERSRYCSRAFKDILVGDFIICIETRFSDSGFLSKCVRQNVDFHLSVHTTTSRKYNYCITEDPRFNSMWAHKMNQKYGYLKYFSFEELVNFCKYCFRVNRMHSML